MTGHGNRFLAAQRTSEIRAKRSAITKKLWQDKKFRKKNSKAISKGVKRQWSKPKSRARILAGNRSSKRRERSRRAVLVRIRNGDFKKLGKPNKVELALESLLSKYFPGEFKLNVQGDFVIGGKIPDFVNCNGKKALVELFGDYWHGESFTGRTKIEEEISRQAVFSKYGFKTLIVWEHELKNPYRVYVKISRWMQ